jgi:AraC-like DNA-binding protein
MNAIVVKDKILYQDEETESFLNTLDVENLRNEDTIIKDSRYVGSFDLSNLGMSVISIIDLSKYTNQVELYLNLLMFLFVAIILFSVVYSLRQSEKINKPIKELAAKIKDAEENKGLSNYEIINQRIDDFINSKDYLTTKLQEQDNTISTLFLYSLLHSEVREENAYIEMGTLHINFNYSSFYVGIMSDKNLSLIDLKYLVDEIEGDQMDIYTYICNSALLFFLNTDIQNYESEIIELFENYFKESNENIDDLRLLVSSKCDGLADLNNSYKNVLSLYNSNITRGYYVMENSTLNELKKSLEMNDNNLYFDAIDKIFNDNMKLSSSLVEEYVDLINREFSDEILKADVSGYYWKSDFINVIKQKVKSSETIVTKANEIIQNEFTNKDLGLYNIAERLDVSNSYLSTIYKDYYGRGIISTLNIKRIELAKVLLLNSNKSIKEVALEVGFASDISFIRVFKKLESQTPGKMRRLNSKRK